MSNNVTVKHKDNVFCLLYNDKKNLLDLYNALNNSSYTDVDGLTVTTLENGGSYMKYKNDASFVFCQSLYMLEQQATKNKNMPLRQLHYVSDVYRGLFSNSDLHRMKMLKIPVPHFITFYNGQAPMHEDEIILKLSDMFEYQPEGEPELELKVRVININNDSGILTKSVSLRGYMTFVNKVRVKRDQEKKEIRTAVTEAVDECIAEDVLADFFTEHREEVIEVSIYDYDEEGVIRVNREEGYEDGLAQGISQGKDIMLISQIIPKVKKEKSLDRISEELELEPDDIRHIYDAVVAAAPEYDAETIKETIMNSQF